KPSPAKSPSPCNARSSPPPCNARPTPLYPTPSPSARAAPAPSELANPSRAASRPTPAKSPGTNPPPTAPAVGGLSPPQVLSLGLDLGAHSPRLLQKMVFAGSNAPSFQQAQTFLDELGDHDIDKKAIERACHRIGAERLDQRQQALQTWQDLTLVER